MLKALRALSSLLMVLALVSVAAAEEIEASAPDESPVLLELFTSQGCSSCPPADRLLTRLAEEEGVVALAYHVDYWNYIGWTDPFSSPLWSRRQKAYSAAFESGRIFTPQLVVDGRVDLVGSNESQARRALAEARTRAARGLVDLELDAVGRRSVTVAIEATVGPVEGITDEGANWEVMLAVFENDLTTPVPRGENAGRTLRDSHVVHRLTKAFTLPAETGSRMLETLTVELEPDWELGNVGIAVFLQDPSTLAVYGSALRYLGSAAGS